MSDKKQNKPEIPNLKTKEAREKKGGAVAVGQGSGGSGGFLARWFGAGARPAGSALSSGAGSAARVAGRASIGVGKSFAGGGASALKLGLVPSLINFFSSSVGMGALTAAISGSAAFALFTMSGVANEARQGDRMLFPSSTREAIAEKEDQDDPGSINFFTSANQGKAFNRDAPKGEAKALADAEEYEEGEEADAAAGNAPDMADELVGQLEKPKMIASKGVGAKPLGQGVGLVGGVGLAGGVNRKFTPQKENPGKLAQLPAQSRKLTASPSRSRVSRVGGRNAMKQLRFANRRSVKATGQSSAESQAFQAAEAFDSAPQSAGGEIGGAGVSQDGAGASSGANSVGGADDGGPIADGTRGEEDVDKVGKSGDETPYTGMLMMAQGMLLLASIMIAMMGILSKFDKTPLAVYLTPIKMALYAAAIGMAAAATAIGLNILMTYGQNTQAMILTVSGGLTTVLATLALVEWSNDSVGTWLAIIAGISGLAGSVGSFLVPKSGGGSFGAKS
ncbi:MAG: hypothetical protein ABIJ96_03425 [Elusimicrobiota bacterium]